ncbi:MAG: asparagine synthase (glutamine-hydrolyzing) [Candidatus Woesebacteria bacterium]|nr:asparagine synthase (glutamine-hydrolyzing) [Candidatus Woesebacteria bacterium]
MCGIVGYVGDCNREKINKMLQATAHRGPDASGIFIKGNVGLGNNRLSIIDLSPRGHQPMFDDKKSLCIVYNGEIYNFMEVRRKLEKEYKFKSNTDTEVVIYAYRKWGINCLKFLNGMFAFVIYDMKNNLLFGARDRLGEKPLKYYFDDKTFIFASEIKGILSVLKEKPGMDFEAVSDYLTLQYVPAPKTGFKNIYKLPPASYFIFKNGKLKIYKYWNLDFSKKLDIGEDEWIELLEEKINKSVKERMVSDVPIGAFLSGGVDSSAIVAFMAKSSNRPIKTFNIGFSDPKYDETDYAKEVSKIYRTDHSSIRVDSEMFKEVFTDMANYYDEPFADNSLIPSIILSKLARKKMKVALSGDGGDENFAGYDRYNIVAFGDYYRFVPKQLRNNLIRPIAGSLFSLSPNLLTSRIKTFADTFDSPFYKKYLYYKSFFNNNNKQSIFSGKVNKMLSSEDTFLIDKGQFDAKLSRIDNALKSDINSYLSEDLLFKTDIASMSVGLEVRAPLLDYELMELTAKMPSCMKIRNFNKKYIFKKMLVKRKILPEEVVNRPKRGFVAPIGSWLKNDLKEYALDRLNSKKFRESEIFDNKRLDEYIKTYYSTNLNYHNNMFALLTLSNWINKYY